jgi:endonuclease-3
MDKKEIANLAVSALKKEYPNAICSLEYSRPFELLISTRLAAQCTDARVNLVAPVLFDKYPSIEAFCDADISEVEEIIKSCGLYKTKARDIILMCQMLKDKYNSVVPDNIDDLVKLPGVGRKTANLIVGDVFHKPSIVVDTHCIRITRRLGLHNEKNATKIELILKSLLRPEESSNFCHRLVFHGRAICRARKPLCNKCVMYNFCERNL